MRVLYNSLIKIYCIFVNSNFNFMKLNITAEWLTLLLRTRQVEIWGQSLVAFTEVFCGFTQTLQAKSGVVP
jgi:hypothetical protein